MSNRRADAVFFGFDFQVNAAIVLMLENIKELASLRLEGNYEDIDLELVDGKHILAQAKAIEKSSTDFQNVRKNLKKALTTLSEGGKNVEAEKLILITNSPNPLNEDASRSIFYGHAHRTFSSLPESSQTIITDYLHEIEQPLNPDIFSIQVVPFETDDDAERYKVIMQVINDFIGDIRLDIPGIGKQLHRIWCSDIFQNGSKKDAGILLSKKSVVWPIIVIATDISRLDNDFIERFDSVEYDEIVRRYKDTIDSCCERVAFFTKVLYDFNNFSGTGSLKERSLDFTEAKWSDYSSEFNVAGMAPDILEGLTKVILYSVIRRRYDIARIKEGVCL